VTVATGPTASDYEHLTSHSVVSDRFYYAIFIQVMEHVRSRRLFSRKPFRVLRPGGKLLHTGRSIMKSIHNPTISIATLNSA
jgi:2-polyprenyl-3-methyl-5-hydroxy-6-metoxy-1,4-benzoquinol methylase